MISVTSQSAGKHKKLNDQGTQVEKANLSYRKWRCRWSRSPKAWRGALSEGFYRGSGRSMDAEAAMPWGYLCINSSKRRRLIPCRWPQCGHISTPAPSISMSPRLWVRMDCTAQPAHSAITSLRASIWHLSLICALTNRKTNLPVLDILSTLTCDERCEQVGLRQRSPPCNKLQ